MAEHCADRCPAVSRVPEYPIGAAATLGLTSVYSVLRRGNGKRCGFAGCGQRLDGTHPPGRISPVLAPGSAREVVLAERAVLAAAGS